MKREEELQQPPALKNAAPDASGEIRAFAAWMGLILVAMGVAMAGYLFWRIGSVVLDPRGFETQVNRWEFVVRGRTSDAFPDSYETPDRGTVGNYRPDGDPARWQPQAGAENSATETGAGAGTTTGDPVEDTARLVGRVGSKSARAAALLILIMILMLMVKIITSVIHAGIRLAALAGGEREYMKRIVNELVEQRRSRGD